MQPTPPAPDGRQVLSAQPADEITARKFLDLLFGGLAGGYAEFRYVQPGHRTKRGGPPSFLALPLNYEQLAATVLGRNGTQLILVGAAPRCRIPRKGQPGKEHDVLQVRAVWADLNTERAKDGVIEIMDKIRGFPLRPSVVVDAGHTFQVLFVFHTVLRGHQLLDWREMMLGVGKAFCTAGPARLGQVTHLPGTLNVEEAVPRPCTIFEEFSSWTRYTTEEVREAIRTATARGASPSQGAEHGEEGQSEPASRPIRTNTTNTSEEISPLPEDDELRGAGGPASDRLPPDYTLRADGSVWRSEQAAEEKRAPKPVKVCDSPLHVAAILEDIDTGLISVEIAFAYLGKSRSVTLTRAEMADSRRLVAALADSGGPVTSNNARLVTAYLADYERALGGQLPHKKITSRFGRGRSGGAFYLPGISGISPDITFSPSGPGDASLYRAFSSRRGSLQGWVDVIRKLESAELMIPQAAVLASFVPPLQRNLQIPNFILDIHGSTSTGKSTTLKLAASVYGKPRDPDSVILQWMNTQAAVEQVAGVCDELPLFLDDAQHCPATLKRAVVYMIANGRGKGRSARGAGFGETPTWHTVALSTSEEPLHEASPQEGARGRILSIGGHVPPFRPGGAELVQALEHAVALNHGYAGEAFVRHLNGLGVRDWGVWQKRYGEIRLGLLKSSASDIVGRVSGYIAAIQVAAEVACPLLGLPFRPDDVAAWLVFHLNEQQSDRNLALLAVRALADYYVANKERFAGDGGFISGKGRTVHGVSRQHQYVGFLRSTVETVFAQRRWNVGAVLDKMLAAGVLCTTEKERHTKKVSLEGVKHRMVCIKWSGLLPDDTKTEKLDLS